jgi:hypothetical protein
MKMQINHSHGAVLAMSCLAMLITITACNEKKNPVLSTTAKTKAAEIDIPAGLLTDNTTVVSFIMNVITRQ